MSSTATDSAQEQQQQDEPSSSSLLAGAATTATATTIDETAYDASPPLVIPDDDQPQGDEAPVNDNDDDDDDEDDENSITSTTTSTDSTQSSVDASDKPKSPHTTQQHDAHESYTQAMQCKEEGNSLFQSGQLAKASRSYRKGTSILKKHWSPTATATKGENDNVNDNAKHDTSDKELSIQEQIKSLLLTLQTNLSMVCYQQEKYQQSKDIASKALSMDNQNVKALYRRAMAQKQLGEMNAAKQDLKLACSIDPTNRAVKRELYNLVKEMEREKQDQRAKLAKAFSTTKGGSFLYADKEEEEKKKEMEKQRKEQEEQKAREKRKLEWEEECVKRLSKGEEAITFQEYEKQLEEKEKKAKEEKRRKEKEQREKERLARKKAEKENNVNGSSKGKNSSEDDDDDDDDDEILTEKEMQMFRGYKKTKDGRITSYFTREQSEDEKKLLGNIAPKRLDVPSVPQRLDSMQSVSSSKSASVWNNAGTWEEKDTSEWCTSSLKSFLKDAAVEVEVFSGKVSEVKNLTGDASVAFVSGKKRYVFDYSANIKYEIMDEGDDVVAIGTLKLPDITSASIAELEVDVLPWKKAPRMEIEAVVGKCRDALIANIRKQVLAFVDAFNQQY